MELFFFDIETAGQYKDYNELLKNDERGANLFISKYNKMFSKNYPPLETEGSKLNDAYYDNAGIISTYGQIVCISCGFFDNNGSKKISSLYGESERDIVFKFNEFLKKIEKKDFNLSGYRIINFDIPWILHKLHKYQIEPASILYTYDKKPWEMRIVDIAEDWKGKFAWTASFDEVCYELGVKSPKENISGKDVHKYFLDGRIEEIKDYCEMDVSSSMDVSKLIYK